MMIQFSVIRYKFSVSQYWIIQAVSSSMVVKTGTIVHFKRLGSRVSHDSFNRYVLFFSKQCTYCKTNAIYT